MENYWVYKGVTSPEYPTGMVDIDPIADTHTLRFENNNQFFLPVIDGENPMRYEFIIWAEANGGSTWYVDSLSLTIKCPDVLEFEPISYVTKFDSYLGAPIADSIYTFPRSNPTLPKCNSVEGYNFRIISYSDLDGNSLASSSITLDWYDKCITDPCRTLKFNSSQTGIIHFALTAQDSEGQA